MAVGPDKTALRTRFRAYRMGLGEIAYRKRCQAICKQLASLPEMERATTILVYWPMLQSREIDVRPLVAALEGKHIALPVVDNTAMYAAPYTPASVLVPNKWGILEPAEAVRTPVAAIEAAVVPALGADRRGHRLGYGKGYYDRFLRRLDARFICPVFSACLVDALPAEGHDIPMHILATESTVFRTGGSRQAT